MKYACLILPLLLLSPAIVAENHTSDADWERKAAADFLSRYEREGDENLNTENEYALMRWRDDDPAERAAAQEYVYQNARVMREEQQREARIQGLIETRDYEAAAQASRDFVEQAQADGKWSTEERIEYDRLHDRELEIMGEFTEAEQASIERHEEVRQSVLSEIGDIAENSVGGVGGEDEYFRRKADKTNYEASGFQRIPGEYNPLGDEDINLTFTGEMYTHLNEDIARQREFMIRSESIIFATQIYLQRDDLTIEQQNIAHDILHSAEVMYEQARWGRQADFVLIGAGAFADVLLLGLGGPAEKVASKGIAGTKTLFGKIRGFLFGAGDEIVEEVVEGAGRELGSETAEAGGRELSEQATEGGARELGQSYFDDVASRGAEKARELGLPATEIDGLVGRATNPAPGTTAINRASKHLSVQTLEILANLDKFIAQAIERGVPKAVIDDIMARAAAEGSVDAVIFGARNEIAMEIVRANKGGVIIDDFVHAGVEGAEGLGPSHAREAFGDVLGGTAKSHPTTPMDARTLRELTEEFAETGSFGSLTPDEHRVLTQIFDMAQTGVENIYRFDPIENALIKVADAEFVKAATELIETVGDDFSRLADEFTAPPPPPRAPGQVQDDIPTQLLGNETVAPPVPPARAGSVADDTPTLLLGDEASTILDGGSGTATVAPPGRSAGSVADDTPTLLLGDEASTILDSGSGTPTAGPTDGLGSGSSKLAEEGRKALETAGGTTGGTLAGESGPRAAGSETEPGEQDLDDFIASQGMQVPPGLDASEDDDLDLSEFDLADGSEQDGVSLLGSSGCDVAAGCDETSIWERYFDGQDTCDAATGAGCDAGLDVIPALVGSDTCGQGGDCSTAPSPFVSGDETDRMGNPLVVSEAILESFGPDGGTTDNAPPATGLGAAGDAVFYSGMYVLSGDQRVINEGFVADGTAANTFTTNASGELTMLEHMNSLEGSCYPNCAFASTASTAFADVGSNSTHGARWGVVLPPFDLAHPAFTGTPLVNENGPLAFAIVEDLTPRSALPGTGVGVFDNVVDGAAPRHNTMGTGTLDNFSVTVDFPTSQITDIAISGNFGPSYTFSVTEDSSAPFPIRANGSFIGYVSGSTPSFGFLRGAVPGGFASDGDAIISAFGLSDSLPSPGGNAITGSVVVER